MCSDCSIHSNRSCEARLENWGRGTVNVAGLGSVITLTRGFFSCVHPCGVAGHQAGEEGERGEPLCSRLSSELLDPDGDSVGVGQCGDRGDQVAIVSLGLFL